MKPTIQRTTESWQNNDIPRNETDQRVNWSPFEHVIDEIKTRFVQRNHIIWPQIIIRSDFLQTIYTGLYCGDALDWQISLRRTVYNLTMLLKEIVTRMMITSLPTTKTKAQYYNRDMLWC